MRPLREAGYYEIVAGERRYRALTLLAKDGRLEPAEVRCFVISGDGAYENIIENVGQLRLFKQMLESPTRRGRRAAQPRTQKEMVWQRFQRLRQGKVGIRVDPVYQPFLDSLLKYLAGENKGLAS